MRTETKTQKPAPQTLREFLHNFFGHPILAVLNALHLYKWGTYIHDKIFHFNHK